MYNILFIWELDSQLKKHLKRSLGHNKNIKLIFPNNLAEENLLKYFKTADVIIGWRPSLKLLLSAERLKLFINPGTGIKHHVNNFREINKKRNVILVNGHGHSYATAQHAVALLLALMNKISVHHNAMSEGLWRMSDDKDISSASVSLRNKKIGLLGYGAINKFVHKFLSGFDNEFHLLKRNSDFGMLDQIESLGNNKNKFFRYSVNELNNFLKTIDILIIAIPHTEETENLIGKKQLKLLGKNGLLVNVARGVIVNEKDLYDSLKNKIIAGAAIDVWYNYNPKADRQGRKFPFKFPFYKLKNVVMSPHRAASPFDDLSRWDEVIENINRLSNGRKDFLNIVDLSKEY